MPLFRARVLAHRALVPADSPFVAADFAALLEAADFPDVASIAPDELREMCLLALQELEPAEASLLVLKHAVGDRLRKGQLENLSHELGDEKHWEHYPDMRLHEVLFHVSSLMWEAFPGSFPTPDAVRFELGIEPVDDEARALLDQGLHEVVLVRLLADGMPQGALLHRLFEDQLHAGPFPEATAIAWTVATSAEGEGIRVVVTGSAAWLGPLVRAAPWESDARPEPELEAD